MHYIDEKPAKSKLTASNTATAKPLGGSITELHVTVNVTSSVHLVFFAELISYELSFLEIENVIIQYAFKVIYRL